ncbi:GNAT family N-acetyltransferase [Rugamonas sp. CCM 8940]|uniref:GNAT family N-acetyltransferase n=1 Tax=Rugamonas sp. CCM 8940 TaxID=2765359 RepID=UPI0018F473EE|nr:GNAT family N-acetyltransferase [Rugamonas sp. CCM 8940]MBJ7312757.1 GNAT family N-acetyltransferase [Rugamonas sp. CCM 8940]
MQTNTLSIRSMQADELDMVLDWAAAEGWNPGLHDAASFYAADPAGFLLGLIDGEAVASIFAVRYGATFGFIGGYIVRAAWRGQGHGMAMWRAAMARLAGRNVGLDGVVAQQANYAKSGFQLAHRNIRYQGRGGGRAPDVDTLVPLASLGGDAVCRYDSAHFPDDRARFLQSWIAQAGGIALGVAGAGALAGYGVLRPCRSGYKIGPLFADTPAVAEQLFIGLTAAAAADAPVFIDVPEANGAAVALALRHDLQACFETARMYTRRRPAMDMARQFGITTLELG